MAKKKNGFDTSALLKYADQLDAVGGSAALKRATEAGMAQAKATINRHVTASMQTGNLPAGGKYSTGLTLDSLHKSMAASWSGNTAEMSLGFAMNISGITSIMLLYGTPKMKPVDGLYDAIYGKTGRTEARKAQEEAIKTVLERLGG